MHYLFNAEELPHITYMNLCKESDLHKQQVHISDEYTMIFIKSGTMNLREHVTIYSLKENDFIILDPHSIHERISYTAVSYYCIQLQSSVFKQLILPPEQSFSDIINKNRLLAFNESITPQDMYKKSQLILPKRMNLYDNTVKNKFELAIDQAIFASAHHQEHFQLILSACFLQILIELANFFSIITLTCETDFFSKPQQIILSSLTDYLHLNYNKKLTGSILENEFQMNFDYLNRLFKKKHNTPIFTYLNTIRINKALELLISGNTKLYDIAKSVGFSDEYYFSKVFKKQFGIAPKNYLKLYK